MNTKYLLRSIAAFPRRLLSILVYLLALQWLMDLIALVRRYVETCRRGKQLRQSRRGRPLRCSARCAVIPPQIYKRADPMIYSQYYLMEQGLAVTWDNPDIQLYQGGWPGGSPVDSSSLAKDTDYDVVATIYNNSMEAPAVGLTVEFAFLTFGVGTTVTPLGAKKVDLPVKGSPQHPVRTSLTWHTPKLEGHYCLLVGLVWPDDANPKNNLGQENTNVGLAASPATFMFPVRNGDTIRKRVDMTADAYAIPRGLPCRDIPTKQDSDRRYSSRKRTDVFVPPSEQDADWTLARVRHGRDAFPIPKGWTVDIRPLQFELNPGAQRDVTVVITPPGDFRGERPFNINAMHGAGLLGGVTLIVRK